MFDDTFAEVMPILAMFFGIYGFLFVGLLVSYILNGVGIMRLSAALGVENGWLGFIPYANNYQLGRLAGEVDVGKRKITNPGLWMVLLPLISGAVFAAAYAILFFSMFASTMFTVAGNSDDPAAIMKIFPRLFAGLFLFYIVIFAASIVTTIFRLLIFHKIFSHFYSGQQPVFYMLLGAFVPFALGILMMKTAKFPVANPPPYMLRRQLEPHSVQVYPSQPPYWPQQPPPYGPGPGQPPYGGQYPQQDPYSQPPPPPPPSAPPPNQQPPQPWDMPPPPPTGFPPEHPPDPFSPPSPPNPPSEDPPQN